MAEAKYTKADIVSAIYEKTGIEQQSIKLILEAAMEEIKNALCADIAVELRGFGTFEVRKRNGRHAARNFHTGEYFDAAPHGVAVWRPGQEIKQGVRHIGAQDGEALK